MSARTLALASLLLAACAPETTSFRPTDRVDGGERASPAAAVYDVRISGDLVANVHVWSTGGYIGTSDEPMTQVGIEIANVRSRPIVFDGDDAALAIFDASGAPLPDTRLVAIVPLGPSQVTIAPGATQQLELYFQLPVRPRVVDSMQARWSLVADGARSAQVTNFVRDDAGPVVLPPERPRRASAPVW